MGAKAVFQRAGAIGLLLAAAAFAWVHIGPAAEPAGKPALKGRRKGKAPMGILLTSKAFEQGKLIAKRHTGEGEDLSPPLAWSGAPEGTKEFALIMDDPDAPTAQPWVHWVIYKIAPTAKGLPEGVPADQKLDDPAGALQGRNSFGKIGYGGPYPPKGHGVHHYHFRLYALNAPLAVAPGIEKKALLAAMKGHVLAEGELVGLYQR